MTDMTEPTGEELEAYFQKIVLKYNCGDIGLLLGAKLPACGPLLACTMNGIDLVGGMMNGFGPRMSGPGSKAFMQKYLSLPTPAAEMLYRIFRCGLAHEGTTKLHTFFFVNYDAPRQPHFLAAWPGGVAFLNVTELALQYMEAVSRIALNVSERLRYIPLPQQRDKDAFQHGLTSAACLYDEAMIGDFLGLRYLPGISSGRPNINFVGSGGGSINFAELIRQCPELAAFCTTSLATM